MGGRLGTAGADGIGLEIDATLGQVDCVESWPQ